MITERDLQTVFIVFYDNNPSGYNVAFTNAGYSVPSNADEAKKYVVRRMYDLYRSNPAKLKTIMDTVSWNSNAGNYTTANGDVRDKMWDYLRANIPATNTTSKINWDGIKDWMFGNQTTVVENTTTTPSNAGAIAGTIGASLLGIGIIVFAIVMSRRFAGNKKALLFIIIGALFLLALDAWLIYAVASKITSGSSSTSQTTTGHGGITDILGNVGAIFTGTWWGNIFGGGDKCKACMDKWSAEGYDKDQLDFICKGSGDCK